VIKVSSNTDELAKEIRTLLKISKQCQYVPQIIKYGMLLQGKSNLFSYMIIPKYQTSLLKLYRAYNGELPLSFIRFIGLRVLEILESIHSAGYLHNDLKMDSIMIDMESDQPKEVYLADFGIATQIPKTQTPQDAF
jgi:serine/threonine protein kinase